MSSSVLERTRALHADVEEMRERLLDNINKHASTSKDRILLDHELKEQFDQLLQCQTKLLELYEDADGTRAAELRNMIGGGAGMVAGSTNEALWTTFYDSLSQIRIYHAKFPNAARAHTSSTAVAAAAGGAKAGDIDIEAELDALSALTSAGHGVHFSAEECFGERVDMHALHERYINLPHFSRTTDYLTFLSSLPSLGVGVPRERKLKASPVEYRRFVQATLDYLTDFHTRTSPLVDVETLKKMVEEEFDTQWNNKTLPGWFDDQAPTAAAAAAAAPSAAAAATSAAAASSEQEPGAAAAAAAPSAAAAAPADASNPLYCVACAKLFNNENTFKAHLPGKKHKKNEEIRAALLGNAPAPAAAGAASNGNAAAADANASGEGQANGAAAAASSSVSKLSADLRSLALLEFSVCSFAQLLSPALESTRTHLLKKQTRTFEELAAELAATEAEVLRAKQALKEGGAPGGEGEEEEEENEDGANAPIYNPLNLPLGFDGKPIPYWLYKLHGLNLKFNCEICGDFSYAGPRNFERHFTEWRHAYGMRALGIPNTKHFAHITRMADAQALFEKLKKEGVGVGFRAEEEEEMEDAEGNVFNKKTFMELQRQGLV